MDGLHRRPLTVLRTMAWKFIGFQSDWLRLYQERHLVSRRSSTCSGWLKQRDHRSQCAWCALCFVWSQNAFPRLKEKFSWTQSLWETFGGWQMLPARGTWHILGWMVVFATRNCRTLLRLAQLFPNSGTCNVAGTSFYLWQVESRVSQFVQNFFTGAKTTQFDKETCALWRTLCSLDKAGNGGVVDNRWFGTGIYKTELPF